MRRFQVKAMAKNQVTKQWEPYDWIEHYTREDFESKIVEKGFDNGEVYEFAGPDDCAKNGFMNDIADESAISGKPVLIFCSYGNEMDFKSGTYAKFSSYSYDYFLKGSVPKEEMDKIARMKFVERIEFYKTIVEERIPIEDWDLKINEIARKCGKNPFVIVEEFNDVVSGEGFYSYRELEEYKRSKLSELASRYSIPVLVGKTVYEEDEEEYEGWDIEIEKVL